MLAAMSQLLDRLTAAGWISGSYLNGTSLRVVWTPEGIEKALALRQALDDLQILQMDEDSIACLVTLLTSTLPDHPVSDTNSVAHDRQK